VFHMAYADFDRLVRPAAGSFAIASPQVVSA